MERGHPILCDRLTLLWLGDQEGIQSVKTTRTGNPESFFDRLSADMG